MFIKTITYEDFSGKTRTEEHFFHLTQAELMKWMATSGDYTFDKVLERLYTEKNIKEIINTFENLFHISYGKKSLDGRRFEKSEEIWEEFHQTEAYSKMFIEVIGDAKKAAEFIQGIMPKEVVEELAEALKKNPDGIPDELKDFIRPIS